MNAKTTRSHTIELDHFHRTISLTMVANVLWL